MKKILIVLACLLTAGGIALITVRILSGEDNWICQNGQWVRHGVPLAPQPTTPCPQASSLPISTPTPSPIPTPTESTQSAKPQTDEIDKVKAAIYAKTGLTKDKAEVSVNKITPTHATGNIKEFEAVGGAYWIAAKKDGKWVAVYDGQSQPECSLIKPYDFPLDMVPECLNASGKVISR